MPCFDKFDVFMKMLEIIEQEETNKVSKITDAKRQKIINIIERIEGNFVQENIGKEEIIMEGDQFKNINQAIIATRGSIAKGIIQVRSGVGDEVADALEKLEKAIAGVNTDEMTVEERHEALQLLEELTKHASSPGTVKVVLESLGKSLWKKIETVKPILVIAKEVWPIIAGFWS